MASLKRNDLDGDSVVGMLLFGGRNRVEKALQAGDERMRTNNCLTKEMRSHVAVFVAV